MCPCDHRVSQARAPRRLWGAMADGASSDDDDPTFAFDGPECRIGDVLMRAYSQRSVPTDAPTTALCMAASQVGSDMTCPSDEGRRNKNGEWNSWSPEKTSGDDI